MSTDATGVTRDADSPKGLERARWTGLKTIIIREYGRIIRIWAQTIVPSAVTSALYFVICFGLSQAVRRLQKKIAIIR